VKYIDRQGNGKEHLSIVTAFFAVLSGATGTDPATRAACLQGLPKGAGSR
jgi:hypothetical protein